MYTCMHIYIHRGSSKSLTHKKKTKRKIKREKDYAALGVCKSLALFLQLKHFETRTDHSWHCWLQNHCLKNTYLQACESLHIGFRNTLSISLEITHHRLDLTCLQSLLLCQCYKGTRVPLTEYAQLWINTLHSISGRWNTSPELLTKITLQHIWAQLECLTSKHKVNWTYPQEMIFFVLF